LKSFFDPSSSLLKPEDLVLAFTHRKREELALPTRAVITFVSGDLHHLRELSGAEIVSSWRSFRPLYRPRGKETIIVRCHPGGPNVAALLEELSAFGVREFCLWGYCGGIAPGIVPGKIILATSALREDGISSHYLNDEEDCIGSDWAAEWEKSMYAEGYMSGTVWSTDALYRETLDKVARYRREGILAVEMEVASCYAVCRKNNLSGAAFLVCSDVLDESGWKSGFQTLELKVGARKLLDYILTNIIV
jgi:uridine phosphorylase